jgi:hypothetical protein
VYDTDSVEELSPEQLRGFFVGWKEPLTPEEHLRLLRGSDAVVLARDESTGQVIGFITAITDGVLSHVQALRHARSAELKAKRPGMPFHTVPRAFYSY